MSRAHLERIARLVTGWRLGVGRSRRSLTVWEPFPHKPKERIMSTINTSSKKNGSPAHHAEPRASAPADLNAGVIRRRAYEIFVARRGGPGDHLSDWVQAERELRGTPAPTAPARPDERSGTHARSDAGARSIPTAPQAKRG